MQNLNITFDTQDSSLSIPKNFDTIKITEWIAKVIKSHNKQVGDIAYVFCTDEQILEANRQFLQHDYYTDIITFDYCEDEIISGDLLISLETVRTNADLFDVQFDAELQRVIIHGILHLCGFGDKTEQEEIEMRKLENQALELL